MGSLLWSLHKVSVVQRGSASPPPADREKQVPRCSSVTMDTLDTTTFTSFTLDTALIAPGSSNQVLVLDINWTMIVIQALLLAVLVVLVIAWALCCRRTWRHKRQQQLSVIEALRKVSATLDLPPTYSSLSLHPAAEDSDRPPAYCDLFTSNLQYLDPELGQPRTKRSLSSSSVTLPVPRLQPANSYSEDTASTRRISV